MMKKMWKKNTKAVSPVIATILMVAITVVLAAVLYVMVMGFGGEEQTAPNGALGVPQITRNGTANNYNVTITIVSINPSTPITDLDYKLGSANAADLTLTADTNHVKINDIANDGQASSGDQIVITGITVDTTFYLIYEPTGDVIDSVAIDV
jgi:flagellin-like protein